MSETTFINHQQNLDTYREHDTGYSDRWKKSAEQQEADRQIGELFLIINGSLEVSEIIGLRAAYITIDENYSGNMSPGQEKLYELLYFIQRGTTYSTTTIKKISESMGVEINHSTYTRLENLQSIGAITGFKFKLGLD